MRRFKRDRNFWLISLFICLSPLLMWSQLQFYVRDDQIKDTLANIRWNLRFPKSNFCFPGFNVHKEFHTAFDIKAFPKIGGEKLTFKIPITVESFEALENNYPILFSRMFSSNIGSVSIYEKSNDTTICNIATINFDNDGFQWPIEEYSECFKDGVQNLFIEITKNDENLDYELKIGELWIGNYQETSYYLSNFGLKKNDEDYIFPPKSPIAFESYGIYKDYPKTYFHLSLLTNIFAKKEREITNKDIAEIVSLCINKYPYFQELSINKETVTSGFHNLIKDILNLNRCDFINKINEFLLFNFSDPHFKISSKCSDKNFSSGPIRLYPIKDEFLIASIFDDQVREKIPLGSSILKLNNQDFPKRIREIKTKYAPIKNERYRNRIVLSKINHLLFGIVGDKISVEIRTPNDKILHVGYTLKKRYKVPKNFIPNHCEIKVLNKKTVYFRLNKFFRDIALEYAQNYHLINQYQNLVIDLRGNGGGEGNEGARLLSYLINKDFTYARIKDIQTDRIDSLVVKPNDCFEYRSDGNIVLLIDGNTACASELFIDALKKNRQNVALFGKEKTLGTAVPNYHLYLEEAGTKISTNSPTPFLYMMDDNHSGIKPDFEIEISEIEDLKPYDDKVLLMALDYLNSKSAQLNK